MEVFDVMNGWSLYRKLLVRQHYSQSFLDLAIKMARRFNRSHKIKQAKTRANNKIAQRKRQQITKITNLKTAVLNLSNYNLNDSEITILAKGLKFIPSPRVYNTRRNIMKDFLEFARKLRCKYHFHKKEEKKMHPFRVNSGFVPEKASAALESYIDKTRLELTSLYIRKYHQNISNEERKALTTLKQNKDIIIKKADKSNTIVILNRQKYIAEGMRQLSSNHYREVDFPNLTAIKEKVQDRLNDMHEKGSLDEETFKYLSCLDKVQNIGYLYLLPKIHKFDKETLDNIANGDLHNVPNPTGRPIISQIGTVGEKIGRFCDYFLKPIVHNQNTYIRDTADFITKIEKLRLSRECLLVSYDVTSMYTNMTFDELLRAVKRAYDPSDAQGHTSIPCPDVRDLLFLLHTVLDNNYLEFNDKIYKQTIGAAMGAVPSPEMCDIRMFEITQEITDNFIHRNKIIYHGRYRDDGIILFEGNKEEIENFFSIGNALHKLLKLTYQISDSSIVFLDTELYKGKRFIETGILDIKSYVKPTNNFHYLHRNSAHSPSVFRGFMKGERIKNYGTLAIMVYLHQTSHNSNVTFWKEDINKLKLTQ
ncbi:hypothetical protein FSP39_000707 [Pinctada imbricata]|uniref:Reverse transcriptase domain-containing protein n=1 Tax=Pinctada imbricata TaxID=66713 RepID=A0AA88XH00_PINIB|nr:hypothetical protein FSP39_000707 [Pinctada imbricata]